MLWCAWHMVGLLCDTLGPLRAVLCRAVPAGRQVAACQGHTGALLPSHIRAAYQLLSEDGKVPHKLPSKPLRLC
jgi:hypothetical protein